MNFLGRNDGSGNTMRINLRIVDNVGGDLSRMSVCATMIQLTSGQGVCARGTNMRCVALLMIDGYIFVVECVF